MASGGQQVGVADCTQGRSDDRRTLRRLALNGVLRLRNTHETMMKPYVRGVDWILRFTVVVFAVGCSDEAQSVTDGGVADALQPDSAAGGVRRRRSGPKAAISSSTMVLNCGCPLGPWPIR